jgi:hypothetical protein
MNSNPDYKISVGEIARTFVYEDSQGRIRFTFDLETTDGKKLVFLERPGKSLIELEQVRIDLATERTKHYLVSRGYQVEISGR